MLLRTLQTTTPAGGDQFDALTLVLLVVFIASMAGLSFLLRRKSDRDPVQEEPGSPPISPEPPPVFPPPSLPPRQERPKLIPERDPVWLDGVRFPPIDASLSDATRVIEGLLTARRDHDLARGLQFYSPELLDQFHHKAGSDDAEFAQTLAAAEFESAPPDLRSVELIEAKGNRMSVRAGYADGRSEIVRLVRIEGRWLVGEIERAREKS